MSLQEYNKKRDFKKTSEPLAGKPGKTGQLRFVIQKHHASRLHYDFRLEMNGVLKSWAVPKGPSLDPKTKRLAMMVEDHPYDYKDFEGTIPKGEYGAGTVIIWDEGFYEPIAEIKNKKAQEKHLIQQLEEGSLKIILHGEKLKGEFALVKTSGMAENSWLLIKHKDEHANLKDITKQNKSVRSGKPLEQVVLEVTKLPETKLSLEKLLRKTKKSKIPIGIKPMLATLVSEPLDDPDWVYEVKWDGYRALGFCLKDGDVQLLSRNNKQFNDKFYPLYQQLKTWKLDLVIDGEVVVLDDKGISNFGDLQHWRSEADGELVYYVFDILWFEGKDLTNLPLNERQQILQTVLPKDDDRIRLSTVFKTTGLEFLSAAEKTGLEGIIAKKSKSLYQVNNRSADWLKIKLNKRQEVVIAGFTQNQGTSKLFSSLLLAVYDNGTLRYAGKVGTGFKTAEQKEIMAIMKPLIIKSYPFKIEPQVNKASRFRPVPPTTKITWLKPELVCEVAFTEITTDGVFRHPSFKGMRIDKKAKDVILEAPEDTKAITAKSTGRPSAIVKPPLSAPKKTLLNPKDETQIRKIEGAELKFTNLSKVYWPKLKVTKRDMFNYYDQIADYILPYLKDRPMSLNRYPGGINSKSFYQKDVKGKAPDWADTFPYKTSDGEQKEYLLGNNKAALLWMASLGCIEMNPWFSRSQTPDNPDYCVLDLDPDQQTFDQVIEVAQRIKTILDQMGVTSYPKTSGSTGIHIYIPLAAQYTYEQSQLFAKVIVNLVHQQVPEFTTLERLISDRKGKMYLDYLQNRPGATIAGPYSLRPKPEATVSMPLDWNEVQRGLKMEEFTIFNAVGRVLERGDLFSGVLAKGIDMTKAIQKAKEIFG